MPAGERAETDDAAARLRARERQQAAVASLGLHALRAPDADAVFGDAVSTLAEVLQVELAKVLELLPDGRLLLRAGVGWRPGLVGAATVGGGRDSQAGYTLLSGDPVVVEDLRAETRFRGPPLLHDHGVVSGMSVIIHAGPRPYGVLGIHTAHARRFTRDDVNFLQAVANVLGAAVERQEARAALTDRERQFRAVFDNALDAMLLTDDERRYVEANPAACRLLGRPREEILRLRVEDVTEPALRSGVAAAWTRFLDEGVQTGEHRLARADGALVDVEYAAKAHVLPGLHLSILRDVTARNAAERELHEARHALARSDKLAALGTLVSGVAHEMRTPLTYIATSAFLARRALDRAGSGGEPQAATEAMHHLSVVQEGVDRANHLVEQLRRFTRPRTGGRASVPLDALVSEAVSLFRATHAGDAPVHADLRPAGRVVAEKEPIQQVVINLLQNAVEASRGTPVRIATRPAPEGGACILVEDEGHGIPPDLRERIFEPLFTTKEHGMGLGLAIVRRIVVEHRGTISCESQPGKGTRFTVRLPCA